MRSNPQGNSPTQGYIHTALAPVALNVLFLLRNVPHLPFNVQYQYGHTED